MSHSNEDNCNKKPCQSRSIQCKSTDDDPNANIYDRPLLYAGVLWIGVVKKILIPSSCRRSSSTSFLPESNEEEPPADVSHLRTIAVDSADKYRHDGERKREVRLLQPIAVDSGDKDRCDGDHQKREVRLQPTATIDTQASSKLERGKLGSSHIAEFSTLVDLVQDMQRQLKSLSGKASLVLKDSRHIPADALDTLRSEEGATARLAAVAGSGLVGYLAGLRRGAGVRLVYAATGALAAATLCYPRQVIECDTAAMDLLDDLVLSGIATITGFIKNARFDDLSRESAAKSTKPEVGRRASDHRAAQRDDEASRPVQRPPPHHPTSPDLTRRELPPGVLPYSPALPAPPSSAWELTNELNEPHVLPPVKNTTESSGVIEKHFSDGGVDVYIRVVTDAELETDSETDSEDVTPTEEDDTTHIYPLNKKLSRYYQSKKDDNLIPYLDRGNEDLYSKR